MTGNLGATSLKKRRRTADTMAMYDALPQPLRNWLTAAALPRSPKSCTLRSLILSSLSD